MSKRYKVDEDGLMFDVHELRELTNLLANRLYEYLSGMPASVETVNRDIQLAFGAHAVCCENCHPVSHQYIFSDDKEQSEIEAPEVVPNPFAAPGAIYGSFTEYGQPKETQKEKPQEWNLPDLGDDLWDKISKLGS